MDSCTELGSIGMISSESSELCCHQYCDQPYSFHLSGLKPVSVQIIRGSMSPTYYGHSLEGPSSSKSDKEKAQKAKLAALAQKQAESDSSSSYSCQNLKDGVDMRMMASPKDKMDIPSVVSRPIPSFSMLHAESSTPATVEKEAKQAAAKKLICREDICSKVPDESSVPTIVNDKEKAKQAKLAAKKLVQGAGDCTPDNAGTVLLGDVHKGEPIPSCILDLVPSHVEVSTQTESALSVEEPSQVTSSDDSNPESQSMILSISERSSCPSDADLALSSEGTESDDTSSTDQTITIFGRWPQYPPKKFLLMLVLFLSSISPCQQPVDAMRSFTTAMIIHPQYGYRSHTTALLPLLPTKTALIQHPKFGEKVKTTALVLIQPKVTSVILHPRFSSSSCRELAVVPPRSLQKCVSTLMKGNLTPDLKDLLQIIRLHRLARDFDYRHCKLSDNLQCSSLDQLYHQEVAVCPVKSNHTHTKVDRVFTDTLITGVMFEEGNCFQIQFDVNAAVLGLLLSIFFIILGVSYNGTDNLDKHNDTPSEKRSSTNKYDDQSQTCSNGNVPTITMASTSIQVHQNVVPPRSYSLSDSRSTNALCMTAEAANSNSIDSGFGSMHQNLSSNESAGELHTEFDHKSQNLLEDQYDDEYDDEYDVCEDMAHEASLPCLAYEQPMTSYFSDQPPQSDETLEEYCTPTIQVGTPDPLELVQDISACDSEYYDSYPNFAVAVAEKGTQISSLPSLNDQITVLIQVDGPINAVREPPSGSSDSTDSVPDQSVENRPPPVLTQPIPRPNIFTNTPASYHELQENTISFQVEGNHDPQLQGASVTVEPSSHKDLCSLVPPPKPPDISKDLKSFAHHFETTHPPLTAMFDGHHPRPIQESTTQPLRKLFTMSLGMQYEG